MEWHTKRFRKKINTLAQRDNTLDNFVSGASECDRNREKEITIHQKLMKNRQAQSNTHAYTGLLCMSFFIVAQNAYMILIVANTYTAITSS